MGKIVATEFISLDGVIEDPGGSEDYVHGGWTFEIDRGEEGNAFKLGELEESAAQLFGRVTYEGFAEAWPGREDDPHMGGFAKMINKMPKYVYSTTLGTAEWENTTVLAGDFTLGGGKRLFTDDGRKVPLTLSDARTVGDGVQILTYERTAA